MKDKRLLWLAVAPAALGGLAALLLTVFGPSPTLRRLVLFGDWAGLLLGIGLLLSVVLGLVLLSLWWGGLWGWRRGAVTRWEQARERELFYGRLDHELKNPLTALYMSTDNLAREQLTPAGRESLQNARGQIRHLALLVENLRKVASVAGRQMDMRDMDMAEVVEAAVAVIRARHSAAAGGSGRQIILHTERIFWKPPIVCGNRDVLAQAVHNVLENACKFSPPDTAVEVWCQPDGGWLRIKVVDRGPGIPEEDRPHLGEDLYRGEGTARTVPGYGLGLAMVKAILARHGGTFSVESQVQKGAAVTLSLPLAGRLPAKEK